ncbi:MAG: hypothetical protein KF878_03410 [Planctomycetes bacterium]|nr:hypothetical protein [Planctomycetota bacterium]
METYYIPTDGKAPRRESTVFMEGNWTYHAYSMSHDGKANVVHLPDGIEVHRQGRPKVKLEMELPYNPRDFYWHPDSRRVAFWCIHTPKAERPGQIVARTKAVAVMDVTKLGGTAPRPGEPPPYDVIQVGRADTTPFGLEWSPKGDAIYVIQRGLDVVNNESYSVITRVDLSNPTKPRDIVRMVGGIDFFMPPVSRFERGEGPSNADYQIIYGHAEGLFVVDPQGKEPQRLAQIPAVGLYNIEWNPRANKKEVILFFRRAVRGRDGEMFVGAYLVRIDQLLRRVAQPESEEAGGKPAIEQLYDDTDVHTLWYSPRGTYMTWATPSGVWFRRPDEPADKTVLIQPPPPAEGEAPLEVKGVTWHDSERKIAFTAGNKLFLVELPSTEPKLLAKLGPDGHTFLAEPRFVGDEVYLTSFEDARGSGGVRSGVEFGMPGKPVDRSMGRDRSKQEQPKPAPTQGGSTSGNNRR